MKTFGQFLREGWEVVRYRDGDRSYESSARPDDYYYHVTLEPSAKSILRSGKLIPNAKRLMGAGGYGANSTGRVFLTDRNGVSFWASRAKDHAFDQYDDPPRVLVLRLPKSHIDHKIVTPDDVGSRDAHAPAYYVTGGVVSAVNEKVEALVRLPVRDGMPHSYQPVTQFFQHPCADASTCRMMWAFDDRLKTGKIARPAPQRLDPGVLVPTQYHVDAASIADIVRNGGADDPIDVRYLDGRYYIVNGHHRAAADGLLRKLTSAYVFDERSL